MDILISLAGTALSNPGGGPSSCGGAACLLCTGPWSALARGQATGMTGPNGAVLPPLVRSDHRYLLATVAIQRG